MKTKTTTHTPNPGISDCRPDALTLAAPELLAALRLAEDILNRASDALEVNGDSEVTRGLVRAAAIEARAAIAKAEGVR